MNRIMILFTIVLGLFIVISCGDSSEKDKADEDACSNAADFVIPTMHVYIQQCTGCQMGFDQIRICNNGGATSAPFTYEVTLSTAVSMEGEHYSAYTSSQWESMNPGSCFDAIATMPVPNVPPGDYYIYVLADSGHKTPECNESNNWNRTDKWFHIE